MTVGVATLGEVLCKVSHFDPLHFLYLPMDEVWTLETKCAVLPQSDLDGVPDLAQQRGLACALEIAMVQAIVANAREQNPSVNASGLLDALLFYYDHDAFISFDGAIDTKRNADRGNASGR